MSLSPFWADERLVSQLTQRGFRFAQFMTTVFGEPDGDMPPPSADVVVRYLPPAELNGFLAVWLHGRPGDEYEALAPIVQAEFAEWRCYVAFYQSHAAGVAALHVRDGVGVLAAGETLSEFRGHGAQTALLHQRIADARALGCDLVVSQATPTTTSQRNMERVGFRTAYTQTVWVDCR